MQFQDEKVTANNTTQRMHERLNALELEVENLHDNIIKYTHKIASLETSFIKHYTQTQSALKAIALGNTKWGINDPANSEGTDT